MKTITTTLIATIALIDTFCTSSHNQKPDAEKVTKEVNQLLSNYVTDVNSGGLNKAATYFADDARFYWVEDGTVQYPDRAALLKGITEFAPAVNSVHMNVLHTKTDVIDAQHAVLFVQYLEDIELKSKYTIKLDGAMTILVEHKNNAWKFLSGHSSVKKERNKSQS